MVSYPGARGAWRIGYLCEYHLHRIPQRCQLSAGKRRIAVATVSGRVPDGVPSTPVTWAHSGSEPGSARGALVSAALRCFGDHFSPAGFVRCQGERREGRTSADRRPTPTRWVRDFVMRWASARGFGGDGRATERTAVARTCQFKREVPGPVRAKPLGAVPVGPTRCMSGSRRRPVASSTMEVKTHSFRRSDVVMTRGLLSRPSHATRSFEQVLRALAPVGSNPADREPW